MKKIFTLCVLLIFTIQFYAAAQMFNQVNEMLNPKRSTVQKPDAKKIISEKRLAENSTMYHFKIEKLNQTKLEKGEEWWQPDTIASYGNEPDARTRREIYSWNDQGYVESLLLQGFVNGVWENTDKFIATYDQQNNLLLTNLHQCWKNNMWEDAYRTVFTYDERNNIITDLYQDWENNDWINNRKLTYTYDERNNQLTELFQDWINNDWKNYGKYTYTYDERNNMLTDLYQLYANNDWKNHRKETYTYDERNNRLTLLYQDWEDNDWKNYSKDTYTYDERNNMLTHLYQDWENNDWKNNRKHIYTYNELNNQLTDLYQNWKNSDWKNNRKHTYTYDGNNNLSESLYQWYYLISGEVDYERKWNYTYNELNYLLTSISQNKYVYDNEWTYWNKLAYTYNEDGNCIFGEHWSYDNSGWYESNGWMEDIIYNDNQSVLDYYHGYKVEVSYIKTTKPSGIEDKQETTNSKISIYPNPAKDQITISIEDCKIEYVTILNQSGKQVKQVVGKEIINISDLPTGLYVLQIMTDKGVAVEKVIKE